MQTIPCVPMPSETVQRLRQQLREQFPAAHRHAPQHRRPASPAPGPAADPAPRRAATPTTHDASLSPLLDLPTGAITEISPAHPACGLTLLLATLTSTSSEPPHAITVLIDARDRFDPASHPPSVCQRLLWLRCRETRQSLQAADLMLRDGNLSRILLDLSALPDRELRRIPTVIWHRLRQLAEHSGSTLIAFTPAPSIPRTALRLSLSRPFSLQHFDHSQPELLRELGTEVLRRQTRTA